MTGALKLALAEYQRMRAQGVSQDDAIKGLELVLRDVFPVSKFGPTCRTCDDLGWREMTCWAEQRCARPSCSTAHPSHEHVYVVPCECSKGDRHRPRARTDDDALAAVGKVKKPKSFSRFGA